MLRWVRFAAILLATLATLAYAQEAQERVQAVFALPSGEQVTLTAEVADTPEERARGLMFRDDFAPGDAMLFIYDAPRRLSFWMKDTPRSLDILYFDGRGRFINIHRATTPFSQRSLPSLRPAQYVLEVAAGEAERLGLGEGTRLILPLITEGTGYCSLTRTNAAGPQKSRV